MIKQFNKAMFIGLTLPTLILILLAGCSKSESHSKAQVSKEMLLVQKFQDQINSIGAVDIATVRSSNNGDSKLYIITAKVIGDPTKKLILYVDERGPDPVYARFILDTNIPDDAKNIDIKDFTGYVKFISLLNAKNSTFVYFDHGTRIVNGKKLTSGKNTSIATDDLEYLTLSPEFAEGASAEIISGIDDPSIVVDSKLTNCIKGVITTMTLGQWILFVAAEPESVATLVLACAIDVVAHPGNY